MKLTDTDCIQAITAIDDHGGCVLAAARALGIPRGTLRHRANAAYRRGLVFSEGAKTAIDNASLGYMEARGGWIHNYDEEGKKTGTTRWVAPDPPSKDTTEAIREALEGLKAIKPMPTPKMANKDLLTTYTLADVHIGMRSWAEETGEEYTTELASERVIKWISQCIELSPPAEEALILDIGDLTHADDHKNMTPGSGHILDVDTRHFQTMSVSIQTIASAIDIALHKHKTVRVRIMRGNHDPNTYIAIMFALAERYRNEPRVDIIKDPMDFFVHIWGAVMIGAHHGDRAKAQSLVLHMADRFPEMWGQTQYRYLFTGHLHHHKSQDIGGVTWEQLRAVTAKDAYAAGYPYSARSEMQAITYHRERGEVSRIRVSNWL